MSNSKFMNKGVGIAVGLLVVGLLAAFLLPTVISPYNDNATTTISQNEDTTYTVTSVVTTNVTNVNETAKEIDVTLKDTDSGTTKSITGLSEGSNSTVTLTDGDITVTNQASSEAGNATVKYEYPNDYGWNGGTKSIYGTLPLFFVLGMVLLVVKKLT